MNSIIIIYFLHTFFTIHGTLSGYYLRIVVSMVNVYDISYYYYCPHSSKYSTSLVYTTCIRHKGGNANEREKENKPHVLYSGDSSAHACSLISAGKG